VKFSLVRVGYLVADAFGVSRRIGRRAR